MVFIAIYGVCLVVTVIFHDVKFDELTNDYSYAAADSLSNQSLLLQILYYVEICFLCIFFFEYVLHAIGYGRLFLKSFQTVFSWLLICANIGLLVLFQLVVKPRYSLFATKLLLGAALFYFRLETLRNKVDLLRGYDGQQKVMPLEPLS